MKFLKRILLTAGLAYAMIFAWDNSHAFTQTCREYAQVYRNYKRRHEAVSLQRLAAHRIVMKADGHRLGGCSGTAIGPHALLIATHCMLDGEVDTLELDLTMLPQHIVALKNDGRDHTIVILDGPAFTHYLPVNLMLDVPQPKAGEQVYIWGDGEGIYPPRRVDGQLDVARQNADVSDLDQEMGLMWYTLGILHGDSGSAVYDAQGRVVGVVSWGISLGDDSASEGSADFQLAFSEHDLQIAQHFTGE